ncbi:hypothetical protein [uncultured Chloroflexus sp.]|uniref:hypothetical protein n=1 Tax=uncultured Chloroflexus sp. TaxID=214040 RepID=UPI00262E48CE|nr:hypothetical protein [uncultured Chloroflexus sp.]
MPITIAFHRRDSHRVDVCIADQTIATVEPAALLVEQPLFAQRHVPSDPLAYGQRLFAALGGDTLRAALAALPRAPHPDSLIAIQTDDPALAAVPWELDSSIAYSAQ